jgi:hypothetical protein
MRRIALTLTLTLALAALATPAARAQTTGTTVDDPTSHPGPGRRAVCLDGVRTLYLTPEEEDIPGRAPTPGPCPEAPAPTSTRMVTVCIQGHTTTAPEGATNPAGYPYSQGPCDEPPPADAPAPVRATPRFTG